MTRADSALSQALEPFTERAAQEVAIEDVERRALILAHPAFPGVTVTTQNLIGAFTVLEPATGKIEDKDALRAALRAADFKSVRGDFRFGPNKTIGTVLQNRADAYVQDCKMK